MAGGTKLLPEDERAFLRHVYNHYYHDFANVEIKDIAFHPITTFDRSTSPMTMWKNISVSEHLPRHTTTRAATEQQARAQNPSGFGGGGGGRRGALLAMGLEFDTPLGPPHPIIENVNAFSPPPPPT